MVKKVCIWQNGMVMVFDEHGQQVPDYQGPLEEVRDKLATLPEDVEFIVANFRGPERIRVDRKAVGI